MESSTILFLIFLAIGSPIIFWLMWREDFDGLQSEWRYNRDCKTRVRLSPTQFYDRFYQSSGLKRDTVFRLLSLHADVWTIDPSLIRPRDNFSRIYGGAAEDDFVDKIQFAFGITIPDDDLEVIDGSFDSIAKYVDVRTKTAA